MKKILLSTAMILFVAGAIVAGGTGAFFNDTETSSGNTFTAGAIDLMIDNTSYYNGVASPNTSWDLTDLTIEKFFNFLDLKPGDYGEDTISLHVDTNDSYLCADITLTSNDDNGINEPEGLDGDVTDGEGVGELAENVNFIWWADDGDNVLEDGENVVETGPLGDLVLDTPSPIVLADSDENIWTGVGGPLPGEGTAYMGKAWCFGTISPDPDDQDGEGDVKTPAGDNNGNAISGEPADGGYSCDGSTLNNITQTDSLTADVAFSAVQSRNNPNFQCPEGHCPIGTTNVLVPGAGFELPNISPEAWDIRSSPTGGWNVEWRADVPATFGSQTRPDPANLEYHRGVLGLSSEGDQYVEMDTDWAGPHGSGDGEPASVKIYQDIATIPGKNYEIHYAFAPRPNTDASENNLEVRWGGNVVDTTGPTAGGGGPIAWQEKVVNVTATSATTRIEFTDLGTANSMGTFLDDIRVYTENCVQ